MLRVEPGGWWEEAGRGRRGGSDLMEQLLEEELKRERRKHIWWKGVISEKARGSSGRDASVAGEGKKAVKDNSKRLNIVSWED